MATSLDTSQGFPPVGIYWILTGNIKQQNVGQNTATVSMSIHELVKKLRTKFCHGQKEHKFLCIVGKRSNVSLHKQCLLNEQVQIVDARASCDLDVKDILCLHLQSFVSVHCSSVSVVIISEESCLIEAATNICASAKRLILICPQDVVNTMRHVTIRVSECYCFHTFIKNLPCVTCTLEKCQKGIQDERKAEIVLPNKAKEVLTTEHMQLDNTTLKTELVITNAGILGKAKFVRLELQKYVNQYGGKVVSVTNTSAYIRFNTTDEADKAFEYLSGKSIKKKKLRIEFAKENLNFKHVKKRKRDKWKSENQSLPNDLGVNSPHSPERNQKPALIGPCVFDAKLPSSSCKLYQTANVQPALKFKNFGEAKEKLETSITLAASSTDELLGDSSSSSNGDEDREVEINVETTQLNQPRVIRGKQPSPVAPSTGSSAPTQVSNNVTKTSSQPDQNNNSNIQPSQRGGGRFNTPSKTPTRKQCGPQGTSDGGHLSHEYGGMWRYSPRDRQFTSSFQESRVPRNLSFSFSYDGFDEDPSLYQPTQHLHQQQPQQLQQHPPFHTMQQGGLRFDGPRSNASFYSNNTAPSNINSSHSNSPLPYRYTNPTSAASYGFDGQGIGGNRGGGGGGSFANNPYSSFYDIQNRNFRKTPGASRPNSRNSNCSSFSSGSSGFRMSPLSAADQLPTAVLSQGMRQSPSHMLSASDLCRDIPEEGSSTTSESPDVGHPVELMVSNLDYNISAREWKKILFTEFQQQVQVLGVQIQTQPDNTSLAYVRLASIDEARYAISQFHRKKIGYKRIHVSLVDSNGGDQAINVRQEISALLQEVSGHRLPLFKFIEIYEKRYHRNISVSELYRMRDLIEIQEMDGTGRMVVLVSHNKSNRASPASSKGGDDEVPELLESPVCKSHCHPGTKWYVDALDSCCLPQVKLCLKQFAPQVHTLLQCHEGSMPIMSFPACYEVEFSEHIKMVTDGGVPLEHLISCVPGVNVAVTKSGVKKVQWAENKPPSPIEWGKQCASPLLSNQLAQFSREVVDLLKQYPQCRMPFSKYIPSYHHHFGRQCRVADYGYTKLMELFEAIPHIVQIIGGGSRRYVTLSHRAQVKRFTSDLLRVLKSQSSKQISVLDLPIVYNKVCSKKFDITDYGVCYLEDMLSEVPENTIIVEGTAKDMCISLPKRDQTPEERERMKQLSLEVIDLLKNSPQCQMPFNKFIPAYHHHFGKQCRVSDYGFTKLIELFEAIPHVVDMIEEDGEKILVLTGPELLKVLEEHVTSLLKACPGHQLLVPDFLAAYMRHHGHSLSLQDYGVASVVQLIKLIPTVAQVEDKEGRLVITMVDNSRVEQLARRVLMVLMDVVEGKLLAPALQDKHKDRFQQELSMDDIMVLSEQKDFIEVSIHDNENVIKLSALQQFARDVRTLLRVHQGRLALNTFEAAYAQHFGVSLVPASYGYPSVVALLQAIPHMATIRGKGYRRTVLLSQDFQDKVSLSGRDLSSPQPPDLDPAINTSSNDSGVIESQDEEECPVARVSVDILSGSTIPSAIPSPDLQPRIYSKSPLDLIRFESRGPSPDVLAMSTDEKQGLQTPLCRTPISDMLHMAAQLLPNHPSDPLATPQPQPPQPLPRPPPAPSSTAFYSHQPQIFPNQPEAIEIISSSHEMGSAIYSTNPVYTGSAQDCYGNYTRVCNYGYTPSLTTAASLLPDVSCFDAMGVPTHPPSFPLGGQAFVPAGISDDQYGLCHDFASLYTTTAQKPPMLQGRRPRQPLKIEKPHSPEHSNEKIGGSLNDTSGSGEGSPGSGKLGTPRRSRLAARFNVPLSPSSVDRRE